MTQPANENLTALTASEHIGPIETGDAISAKRVANYDTADGVTWQRMGSQFTIQIDPASATVTYIGKALPGTLTSAATWQIKKIDSTSGTSITWASGNSNFDKIYDNRASLSYS